MQKQTCLNHAETGFHTKGMEVYIKNSRKTVL